MASYRQHLPALDLSLERETERVPHDGYWYLLRGGEQVGRFRSERAARDAWKRVVDESGWRPEKREIDAEERRRLDVERRERERFLEYWGNSHKFRARGGVHKNR